MKKKTYEQPRVEVVKVEQTDIICTSGNLQGDDFQINGGDGIELDEVDW